MTLRESDQYTYSVISKKYGRPGDIPHNFTQEPGGVYKPPAVPKKGREYDTIGTMYRYQYVNLIRPYDSIFAHSHDRFEDITSPEGTMNLCRLKWLHGDEIGTIAYEDEGLMDITNDKNMEITKDTFREYFQTNFPKILKHRIRRWRGSTIVSSIKAKEGVDYKTIFENDDVKLTLTLSRHGHQKTLQGTSCCTADRETPWFYDNMTFGWNLTFITAKFKNNKNIASKACLISQKYQYIDDEKVPLRIYTDNIGEPLTCKRVTDPNGTLIQNNPREEKLGLILDNKETSECLDGYLSETTLSNVDG